MKQYHIQFMFSAVSENTHQLYDPIKYALWENGHISQDVFEHLYQRNPGKTLAAYLHTPIVFADHPCRLELRRKKSKPHSFLNS